MEPAPGAGAHLGRRARQRSGERLRRRPCAPVFLAAGFGWALLSPANKRITTLSSSIRPLRR